MKTIAERFSEIQDKNQNYSSLLSFANAVYKRHYKLTEIRKAFSLVEKDDYSKGDKEKILADLFKMAFFEPELNQTFKKLKF